MNNKSEDQKSLIVFLFFIIFMGAILVLPLVVFYNKASTLSMQRYIYFLICFKKHSTTKFGVAFEIKGIQEENENFVFLFFFFI